MSELNLLVAFTSGVVSFFAPCIVPLLPAYIGYISGVSLQELKKEKGLGKFKRQVVNSSIFYIFGFSVVFVILGTTAAKLGYIIRHHDRIIQQVGGVVIMLFALNFMGFLRVPFLSKANLFKLPQWVGKFRYLRAFLLGVIFATAWTPCVGAVLGAILTLAAVSRTAVVGALMLFVYSLGISIPFMIISLIVAQTPEVLKIINRYTHWVSVVAGVFLFVTGFLLFNNTMGLISRNLTYNRLNSWLFEVAVYLGFGIR